MDLQLLPAVHFTGEKAQPEKLENKLETINKGQGKSLNEKYIVKEYQNKLEEVKVVEKESRKIVEDEKKSDQ